MRAIIAITCLFAPLEALADIAQCDRPTMAHHALESDHRDLGGGIISYTDHASIYHDGFGSTSSRLNIVACRTGEMVTVGLYLSGLETDPETGVREDVVRYSVSDEVMSRFDQIVASDNAYTLQDVRNDMDRRGYRARLGQVREVPCGCSIAYPDLAANITEFAEPLVPAGLFDTSDPQEFREGQDISGSDQ